MLCCGSDVTETGNLSKTDRHRPLQHSEVLTQGGRVGVVLSAARVDLVRGRVERSYGFLKGNPSEMVVGGQIADTLP